VGLEEFSLRLAAQTGPLIKVRRPGLGCEDLLPDQASHEVELHGEVIVAFAPQSVSLQAESPVEARNIG
jgi:hypothetical protein